MFVSESIIKNIKPSKIISFLKEKKVNQTDDDKGMNLNLWLGKLIDENKISIDELNDYIYQELLFGKRRLIRIYELKSVRKINSKNSWNNFLTNYKCDSMNYNRIIHTNLKSDEKIKVAAIKSIIKEEKIRQVEIIFALNMKMKRPDESGTEFSVSYIPVCVDLVRKTLTIKVWNREGGDDKDTPNMQLDRVYSILESELGIVTRAITKNPQKVLYSMSKDLFDEFFAQLPNIEEIERKKNSIDDIVASLLEDITLENSLICNGKKTMDPEVIDVGGEVYKLLQQIALYDYLRKNKLDNLTKNINKYVSRIRFNDRDNLSASLNSETGVKCIFDTKTFMCVRNSLELVDNIMAIVVAFVKDRGLLSVKYDASDNRYLSIHILRERYYTEQDYKQVWELYNRYESEYNKKTNAIYTKDTSEAM